MQELRWVRRDEQHLILVSDSGEEFSLNVDDAVFAEARRAHARAFVDTSVKPRDIQSLIRAGKSRAEVVTLTGASEETIERFEGPVLAEREYMVERAKDVAVRPSPNAEATQRFGTVIGERLAGLGAQHVSWDAWKDPEGGWMLGLSFTASEDKHRAVWAFDHRKLTLNPLNPAAVNLSRHGDIGDPLIPTLRAVDRPAPEHSFDPTTFDTPAPDEPRSDAPVPADEPVDAPPQVFGISREPVATTLPEPESETSESSEHLDDAPTEPAGDALETPLDPDQEYARQQAIEDHAITKSSDSVPDLNQTADLLDALRRRRGDRERSAHPSTGNIRVPDLQATGDAEEAEQNSASSDPRNNVSPIRPLTDSPRVSSDTPSSGDAQDSNVAEWEPASEQSDGSESSASRNQRSEPRSPKRGRTSVPSWDDILFGTKGEDEHHER